MAQFCEAPGHHERTPGQMPPDDTTVPAVSDSGIATVARLFCETWAELAVSLPDSYGCELNCAEADAMADLFRAVGQDATADAVIAAHAAYDQPDDSHYPAEEEPEESEPEGWNPGPEGDDQSGMSERRYLTASEDPHA